MKKEPLLLLLISFLLLIPTIAVSADVDFESNWYNIHQNYIGEEGTLRIFYEEDGILGITVNGDEYGYIDSYNYTTDYDDNRHYPDMDGMDVMIWIGTDGKYRVKLINGWYAGTYTETEPSEVFQEDWYLTHKQFIVPGTAHIIDIVKDEGDGEGDLLFTMERDGVVVASFPASKYFLSPDGERAIYEAVGDAGITLTVTKGEWYSLSVRGTSHDGESIELSDD